MKWEKAELTAGLVRTLVGSLKEQNIQQELTELGKLWLLFPCPPSPSSTET